MAKLSSKEMVIKEKSEFIERNAVKLYNMRHSRCFGDSTTIEETLIGILLSKKPLKECDNYKSLSGVLESFDEKDFPVIGNENYALKVLFSATRYVNEATSGEEQEQLRNEMRKYLKYMDNRSIPGSEIKVDFKEVEKVKSKK